MLNKLLQFVPALRASTGQSKRRAFCAFALQIIAQKSQHFACR
jgi:hypothetical protein